MQKTKIIFLITGLVLIATAASAQEPYLFPQPVFNQTDFLMVEGILEFNVEKALELTDRYASIFINPFDAVFLHVEIDREIKDVIIISDAGMNRLTIWQCKNLAPGAERVIELVKEYECEDGGMLIAPSGMDTNAKNRLFDPKNDVIYVADRGHGRIVELAYLPDAEGGKLRFNRSIGEHYLHYPFDVAISAYGDCNQLNADLYVVDVGTFDNDGALYRFDIDGHLEGCWYSLTANDIPDFSIELQMPVSVACFPDSVEGHTGIYITEKANNPLLYLSCTTNEQPSIESLKDMELGQDFWNIGGIANDDYGRVYASNTAAGKIEIYEPYLAVPYEFYGRLGEGIGELNYPTNMVIDTYNGVCEALIFEFYYRFSGLQSFIINGGYSFNKPPIGFGASGLLRPEILQQPQIPIDYVLHDVYPNPFNAVCKIAYELPTEARVKIEVFNIVGQKVATLVDEQKPAGSHMAIFNSENLSSGVYMYRIKTGNFEKTKKMVLLK